MQYANSGEFRPLKSWWTLQIKVINKNISYYSEIIHIRKYYAWLKEYLELIRYAPLSKYFNYLFHFDYWIKNFNKFQFTCKATIEDRTRQSFLLHFFLQIILPSQPLASTFQQTSLRYLVLLFVNILPMAKFRSEILFVMHPAALKT